MSINLNIPNNSDVAELKPRITVIGIGGAGGNAVNNMIASELEGVDFIVANTDAQALAQSRTDHRIQLGNGEGNGLGAGAQPEVGRVAAESTLEEVLEKINGSNMVFIAAGMGGGTGTGAAPVIARAAKEKGILTVGVVTKPFQFEGSNRMAIAEGGIEELGKHVDTLIVIPNQNLFRVANEKTTFADAFKMADNVLYSGVRGVTDLMVMPGMINLDFADIRSVMGDMGKAMMGTGEAEGERRALDAAEAAISNPLLDDISMQGAKGVLINITGGEDITLFEVDEAANRIRDEVDVNAFINFGSTFDDKLDGKIRVTVVATGMDVDSVARPIPTMISLPTRAESEAVVKDDAEVKTALCIEKCEETPQEQSILEEVVEIEVKPEPQVVEILEESKTEIIEPVVEEVEEIAEAPKAPEVEKEAAVETVTPPLSSVQDVVPPAAAPTGILDAFLPKAPVIASDKEPTTVPDPFAAAAMANGGSEVKEKVEIQIKKPKGLSLFERVTGSGKAAKDALSATVTNFNKDKADPTFSASPTSKTEKFEEGQKQLDGLEETESHGASQVEEDLLDIPAFLRRQAN